MKPTLRPDAIHDIQSILNQAVRNYMERTVQNPQNYPNEYPYQTCLTCIHFEEGIEQCKLAKARPPARVIAFGCKEFDYVPF